MKILNLYVGIGGNRKLWEGHEVTAVEYNKEIAKVYSEYFPQDKVIVGDAHEFLLKHYKEFDFIWASPPCPTHSAISINFAEAKGARKRTPKYPDMRLYQEIIFLQGFFKGLYCVENVRPYYKPLIPATEVGRHLFWTNFNIKKFGPCNSDKILRGTIEEKYSVKGFDLSNTKGFRKDQVINNCVNPELGLHIINQALGIKEKRNVKQSELF